MAIDSDVLAEVRLRGGRPTESLPVVRVRGDEVERSSDLVAAEEPLEIQLEGRPVAVTMRTPTPGQDAELALGFLLGEAIVAPADVQGVRECRSRGADGGIADVRLRPGAGASEGWQRAFYATSSCGICGKGSIDAVRIATDPLPDGPSVAPELLSSLPAAVRSRQRVFDRTGGLHAAALFDAQGTVEVVREDVGRHNAVDKAIGHAAMQGNVPLHERILMVSGRASFEIVQKAAVAGVPIVAAVSAPSSLAVQLARECRMTLIGFVRDGGFNVYAGAERVEGLPLR